MDVACVENSGLCDGDGSSRLMLLFSLQNRRPFGQILSKDLTSKRAAFSSLKTEIKTQKINLKTKWFVRFSIHQFFHTFGFCGSSQKIYRRPIKDLYFISGLSLARYGVIADLVKSSYGWWTHFRYIFLWMIVILAVSLTSWNKRHGADQLPQLNCLCCCCCCFWSYYLLLLEVLSGLIWCSLPPLLLLCASFVMLSLTPNSVSSSKNEVIKYKRNIY